MQDDLKSPAASTRNGTADNPSFATDPRGATHRKKTGSRPSAQGKQNARTVARASKQAKVIDLLRRKEGASVAAVMKLTAWQKHSVHGFFAGIIRKKLQLNLVRSGEGNKAAYRIASGASGAPKAGKTAKLAQPRKSAGRKSSRTRGR